MTFFSLSGILISLGSLLMSILALYHGKNRPSTKIWGYFCLFCTFWGFGCFLVSGAANVEDAYVGWQVAYVGAIFLPVLYFHFVYEYIGLKCKKLLIFLYLLGCVFLFINFFRKELLFGELKYVFNEFYCFYWVNKKSVIFLIFYILFHWMLLLCSFFLLLKEFVFSNGIRRNQLKYFITGSMGGFVGGHLFFLVVFGINLYPYANYLIVIYPLIIGYGVVKYRLMDINIVFTRTGIFVAVYSLVLGLPFAIAFLGQDRLISMFHENWWIFPLVSSTVLATAGPFIYLYIQKRAEDKLLQEQRSYQSTLRQASLGMGRIKDLKKLLQLIVHIVARAVRLEHCEIYLLHESSNQFVLKAFKGKRVQGNDFSVIPASASIVQELKKIEEPLIYEEIKQRAQDSAEHHMCDIEQIMRGIDAALVVPSFIEDRLIAIVVLGKKRSGKLYSQDDLAVFSILANQSALAIENAQFYEDMKKTHEQLFRAEKMATIGTMADGLSHQINNRLHAMGFIAGDALDTINLKKKDNWPSDIKETIDELKHALDRIQDNVKRGGEVVEGLLKYTRKGEEGFQPVDFDKLVDSAIEMAQFKIKAGEVEIIKNYNGVAPIYGNFTQLQEVLFNIIDNSYDAVMQRKNELKEDNFKGAITISTAPRGKRVEIILRDNGMGVKEEDVNKLFTPFFTTKLSSKKGTGLGLYVIRKIIEDNHGGKVEFLSRYKIGSETHLLLPGVDKNETGIGA
jgi:signal transduction histidine kinase